MIHLLQIDTGVQIANNVAQNDANKDGHISLGELLTMGGWLMIPLLLLFLITVFVFVERYLAVRPSSRI